MIRAGIGPATTGGVLLAVDAVSVEPWWVVVALPFTTGLAVSGWYRCFSLQREVANSDSS